MTVEWQSLWSHLPRMVWVCVRAFFITFVLTMALGLLGAAASYYSLDDRHWLWGGGASALSLAEAAVAGVLLGIKWAMAWTLLYAFGEARLGGAVVRMLFERLLGLAGTEGGHGERGSALARSLERIPLVRAEALLSQAAQGVAGETSRLGWLRRWLAARLIETVRYYTLARFRHEGAEHGGVDLLRVRAELEIAIDETIIGGIKTGLWLATGLIAGGLALAIGVQAGLAYWITAP